MKTKQVNPPTAPDSGDDKTGLADIEGNKAKRLLAAQVATDALSKVRVLSDGPVADFTKNHKALVHKLEKLILMLKSLED